MLARSDNLDLDDATLTTANAVDGVDAEPATIKQPRHQKLSHRISPVFGKVPLVLAHMLRLSGDSEGKFSAVILKAHSARGAHHLCPPADKRPAVALGLRLCGLPPQRWLTLADVCKRTGADEQAVQLAASKGWINLEPKVDPHSVALLDAGRRLVE